MRTKFRSAAAIEDQYIDKLNAEAVMALEMRTEQRAQAAKDAEMRAKAAALAKEKVD